MLLHINPTRQRGKRTGSLARASGWSMTFFAAGVILTPCRVGSAVASISCCSDFARQPLQEDEPTTAEGPLELDRSHLVGDRPPFSKSRGVPSLSEKAGTIRERGRLGGRSGRTRIDAFAV